MPKTRSQTVSAFQIILSVIQLIALDLNPSPCKINWNHSSPQNRIKETKKYLKEKEEYQHYQDIIIHYNLGIDLYQSYQTYLHNSYDGVLDERGTITSSLYRDIHQYGHQHFKISLYSLTVTICLFSLFSIEMGCYGNLEELPYATSVT